MSEAVATLPPTPTSYESKITRMQHITQDIQRGCDLDQLTLLVQEGAQLHAACKAQLKAAEVALEAVLPSDAPSHP
jgi:exodeoxyribonuclease VII small subunit